MAEILGAVAAAAQLAQLSAQILSSGYSFLSKAAKAPSEVRQLLTETAALDCVLGRLQNITRPTTPTTSATPPTDDPVVALHASGIFKECSDLLVSVQKALGSFVEIDRQRVANLTKRLVWPLREKEVTDALQRLSRLRGIISTAIEASSARTLLRVETTQTKLVDMVTGLRTELSSQRDGERLKEVSSWLCPSTSREREKTLQRNLALRLPGSGKWLVDSKAYAAWKQESGDRLVWINGLPGEGKSVLFSGIVQDLQSSSTAKIPGDILLYHFCTPTSETYNQSPALQFLEDISVQFIVSSEACYTLALQMWKRKGGLPLELSEYLSLLSSFIAECGRIYLLVDALDETGWRDARETQTFLEMLTHLLGEDRPPNDLVGVSSHRSRPTWKVLLASRMDNLINRYTRSWRRGPTTVVRLDAHTKPDLRNFISTELSRRLKDGRLRLRNEALEQGIVAGIARHAGTFLHATLQLDSVTNTRSDKEVKAALANLTSGLDMTYAQILARAIRRYPKRVKEMKEILELLAVVGTISCSALAEQLSIAPGETCLDLDSIVTDPEEVLTPLSQLVYINRWAPGGQSYAKFLHFTVREFLTSGAAQTGGEAAQFHVNLDDAHTRILGKYLQYLAFSDFDDIGATTAVQKYRLLFNAAYAWPYHLRCSRIWERSPSHFRDQILPLLDWFTVGDAENPRFQFWRTVYSGSANPDFLTESDSLAYRHSSHPLAFSIAHGLGCLVDILLPPFAAAKGGVNAHFADGHTCLTTAASRKQLELAQRLLDAGADVDVPTLERKLTPLHIAAEQAFPEMVTLLLKAGASPQARSKSGSTPFYRAARGGSVRALHQLHAAGSEVDARTWDEWTPLMEAVEHGNDEAVGLLLGWGADPTRESTYGTTPLGLALDLPQAEGLMPVIEAAIAGKKGRERSS